MSMTAKSKPTWPISSTVSSDGIFAQVPTRNAPSACRRSMRLGFGYTSRSSGGDAGRHRIFVLVQHPALLDREVHPRRRENVDELVLLGMPGRSMDDLRGDD